MTDSGGWVPLHRSLFERDDWLRPTRRNPANVGYAWAYLIARAQWKGTEWRGIRLGRGELLISVGKLAEKMGWAHKSRAARFLLRLQRETMIETVGETPNGTVYRIVNYDRFAVSWDDEQDGEQDGERDASATATGRERDHSKKEAGSSEKPSASSAREPVEWSARTKRNIAALYGLDSEGTDERVWKDTPAELRTTAALVERVRLVRIAADRLQGEGLRYKGVQFRRTLLTVIDEQQGRREDPRGRSNRAAAADRLFGAKEGPRDATG